MPESTGVKTKRDGQIVYSDSGGANTYTVAYEPGDFSLDVPREAVNLFLDRGVIATTPSIRYGDDQPMTFSHTAYLRDVGDTAAGYATLPDILFRYDSGYIATSWTSTMGSNSDVFTVTVAITIDGSVFGEADKTLTLSFCSVRGSIAEGDPSSISVTGTSYSRVPVLT